MLHLSLQIVSVFTEAWGCPTDCNTGFTSCQ